ncbi:Rab5-interacting [Linderina pennispora]|uniref:Rab5-interacting n=1 Tax=Linderina pennispora TaxID=61395 RepID=A0A1Y1WL02_9FUNG|nr:Rab5-interacting [Linderina pennispora]KAJ1929917.1 hypothetical protein EC988_010073 [Linderina pennispora]ORX73886.1 Rab5-interacting [Linderina pennispora]
MSARTEKSKEPAPKLSIWQKALLRDEEWQKDELRTLVFWIVFGFSVVLGVFYGLLSLRGLPCLIGYFIGSVAVPTIYWTNYLGVDDEDFGGKMEVLGDSIGAGFASFTLTWIGVYTAMQS